MPEVFLYNTLSRSVEEFRPARPGRVVVYSCGLTAGRWAGLGNLRTYILEDVLARALAAAGYEVVRAMKAHDISHEEESLPSEDPSPDFEMALREDLSRLRISEPIVMCRPEDHIQEMIGYIRQLEEIGAAYRVDGNVYFSVAQFPGYGTMAGRDQPTADQERSRVQGDARKRDQRDFVLWFSRSKYPHQTLQWQSPWGKGYPSWHVQCFTLASHYLGDRVDVHFGNPHHMHPHHSNERAVADTLLGRKWVSFWVHNGYLAHAGSRSISGLPRLNALQEHGFTPTDFRYFCLQAHNRSTQLFSWELLGMARNAVARLRAAVLRWAAAESDLANADLGQEAAQLGEEFWAHAWNDLNTPEALSTLWRTVRSGSLRDEEKLALVTDFDRLLGLDLICRQPDLSPRQTELLRLREAARARLDWIEADALRDELRIQGVSIRDLPQGPRWFVTGDTKHL